LEYVTGDELARLKLCGAKGVWAKVCSVRAVKEVWWPNEEILLEGFPSFLHELQGLQSLDFYFQGDADWVPTAFRLANMPKQLRKLVVSEEFDDMALFFLHSDGTPLPLSHHLPHLQEFRFRVDWNRNMPWVTGIPPTLQILEIGSWDPSLPLPHSLLSLYFMQMAPLTQPSFLLPSGLTRLESLGTVSSIPSLVAALPQTLSYLSIARCSQNAFSLEDIAKVPRGLQELRISFPALQPVLLPIQEVQAAWPPALTKLAVDRFPLEYWAALPRTLKAFEHLAPSSELTTPSTFSEHAFQAAWASLPTSLTHLSVSFSDLVLMPQQFPKFPFLRSLGISKGYFAISEPSNLQNLFSPSLEDLEIGNMNAEMAKWLPQGLRQLTVHQGFMSPDLIKHLPRALEEVNIKLVGMHHMVFDPKKRELVFVRDLMRSAHSFANRQLWNADGAYCLPRRIREVTMEGEMELEGFFENLPKNVNFLKVSGNLHDPNRGLESLYDYHFLKTLDLGRSEALTGEYFEWLPRSLTALAIMLVQEIEDYQIEYLPRELLTLRASYAVYLTRDCLSLLPPRLSHFEAQENEYILAEDLPLFPFKFQPGQHSFYHFFRNAKFTVNCGEVMQGKLHGGIPQVY
jgi:hypothetical protein